MERAVVEYLNTLDNPDQRQDCETLIELFERISGESARLWSGSMIGFGGYHYRYASGREGDFFRLGFAPARNSLKTAIVSNETPEAADRLVRQSATAQIFEPLPPGVAPKGALIEQARRLYNVDQFRPALFPFPLLRRRSRHFQPRLRRKSLYRIGE